MNTKAVLDLGARHLKSLAGHIFDVVEIAKPVSPEAAVNLAKITSKLSPLVGNLIEFNSVEFLNDQPEFTPFGKWVRQDPGFPDTIFVGVQPVPGFEIKAWFPLATEITARFRDSQTHFEHDQTYIAMPAWLPEHLIYGRPLIIDVCIVSARSVAEARDSHYHNPPAYLVIEPEDTTTRTVNLQQTNTSGYVFQGVAEERRLAEEVVTSWGANGKVFSSDREYQETLRELLSRFRYRLDTNFAKMDRIRHPGIEEFKREILRREFKGMPIATWADLLSIGAAEAVKKALEINLGITEEDIDEILD